MWSNIFSWILKIFFFLSHWSLGLFWHPYRQELTEFFLPGIHPDRQELAEDLSSHPDLLTGRNWPNKSITELKFSFKWLGYVWGRWCHASQGLAIFAPLIKSWIRVFFHNLNWDSVLYLAGKSTEQFQSELLIRQVMTTCKTSEGSTWQLGKPGICQLTEFRTN